MELEKFEVEGLGTIGVTDELVYNEGVKVLRAWGFEVISSRELAFARLYAKGSAREFFRRNGTRTKEAVIYFGVPLFLSESPLLKSDECLDAAVQACLKGDEIYFAPDFFGEMYQIAREDRNIRRADKRVAYPNEREWRYENKGSLILPCSEFSEFTIPKWAYKDVAGAYIKLMRRGGIKQICIWMPEKEYLSGIYKPFLRQILVCCLGKTANKEGVAGISGNNKNLHEKDRLMGIRKK